MPLNRLKVFKLGYTLEPFGNFFFYNIPVPKTKFKSWPNFSRMGGGLCYPPEHLQ